MPTLIAMRTVVGIAAMTGRLRTHGVDVDYVHSRSTVSAFHRAGITIMAGTDSYQGPAAPASIIHGESFHEELALLVEAGLSPLAALRSATVVPAEYFGFTDRGIIEAGRRADLLLIAEIRSRISLPHAPFAVSGLQEYRFANASTVAHPLYFCSF